MAGGPDVKVLSAWRSMFGIRVLMGLKEKGVEFDYEEQDLSNKSQALLEANPVHKKVPVLIHRGKPICESLIILQYIDETWPSSHPGQGLLPQDPYQRALVRFWADFVDKKLYEGFALIFRNGQGEAMEQGKITLKESMVTMEGALKDVFGGGSYFGGDYLNLVDLTLSSYLPWFLTLETLGNFKLLDESICPHLCGWATKVANHSSVKKGLASAPSDKVLDSARWTRKTRFGIQE